MATLKFVVLKSIPAKDGSYKIRLAISHRQDTRYIATRYSVYNLKQFVDGRVRNHPDAADINQNLRSLMDKYLDILDSINGIDNYTCKQIRDIMDGKHQQVEAVPSFQYVAEKYIAELMQVGKESYAKLLERNLRYFTEFSGQTRLLSDISPETIRDYERWLRTHKNIGETSVNMHLTRTKTIINRAIKMGLISYGIHPFAYRTIKASAVREVDLEVHSIQAIKNFETKSKQFIVVRDLFMLSFYLGGMNMVDLLKQNFKDKTMLEYERTKTSSTATSHKIVIPIIPEARTIIDRWMSKSGVLDFGYEFTYSNFYRYITRTLTKLQNTLGIREHVVFYSARKSFAQFASELGVPDAVIDYCLGHSDKSRGVIRHYTKVKQRQAEICIRRVADYLDHPEQYQDFIDMKMDIMMAAYRR